MSLLWIFDSATFLGKFIFTKGFSPWFFRYFWWELKQEKNVWSLNVHVFSFSTFSVLWNWELIQKRILDLSSTFAVFELQAGAHLRHSRLVYPQGRPLNWALSLLILACSDPFYIKHTLSSSPNILRIVRDVLCQQTEAISMQFSTGLQFVSKSIIFECWLWINKWLIPLKSFLSFFSIIVCKTLIRIRPCS